MSALTRRGFFALAGAPIAVLAVGGAVKASAGEDQAVRPPGGQDPARFVSRCIRCGKCRSVCPEGCVVESTLEEGVYFARLPKLSFKEGYCSFCGDCERVCPTGALAPFLPERDKVGVAVVNEDECLACKSGGCGECADYCEYGAISLAANGRPVVDESKCNGCGRCELMCPSRAFRSYSGSGARGIQVVRV